jgi:hypothetical protein
LLYDQGYTIHGARNQLSHPGHNGNGAAPVPVSSAQSDLRVALGEIIDLLRI